MQRDKIICFVAGHSGGHILPCLTLAKNYSDYKINFITTNNKLDLDILGHTFRLHMKLRRTSDIPCPTKPLDRHLVRRSFNVVGSFSDGWLAKSGSVLRSLSVVRCIEPLNENVHKNIINCLLKLNLDKIPNKFYQIPKFIFKLFIAFIKSFIFLSLNRPEKLITTGGLVSIPVFIAAKILLIKTEIYELNVEPGKATKFLAKFNKNIKICFKETEKFLPTINCQVVKYPVRFAEKDKIFNKTEILNKLNFVENKKIILVLGGSQGSLFLNNLVKDFIENNKVDLQFIHQTGSNDSTNWQEFYKKHNLNAKIFSYEANIKDYYLVSDLIVCRSGAGTLAEIIFFNKKCLTFTLETRSTNHQLLNAQTLAKNYPEFVIMATNYSLSGNVGEGWI